jgi:hypothetical protein
LLPPAIYTSATFAVTSYLFSVACGLLTVHLARSVPGICSPQCFPERWGAAVLASFPAITVIIFADFIFCLAFQAFLDVLKIEFALTSAVLSHLLVGFLSLVAAYRTKLAIVPKMPVLLSWLATMPIAFWIGFAINFRHHWTF